MKALLLALALALGLAGAAPAQTLNGAAGGGRLALLGALTGANMNSTADQAIALVCPATKCVIDYAIVTNTSGSLTAVTGGLFAGAGGTLPLESNVTTSSTWTSMASGTSTRLTLLGIGLSPNSANSVSANAVMTGATQTIFLHLGAGEGSAQTADIYVFGEVLF